MLSRRGFFRVAAGAAAVAAGGAGASAVPAAPVTGVDLAAVGTERSAVFIAQTMAQPGEIVKLRYARMVELFQTIRGQELPPWPYALPNDLTRQQLAADLPVIGVDRLPAAKPARAWKCGDPTPAKETPEQYRRRVGMKCPGMLE